MWKYYIFSLSQFCGGILLPPPLPRAYSHSSGINDTQERRWRWWGVVEGGTTALIKHIGLISGCRIAAYRRRRPTRFCLSSARASHAICQPRPRGQRGGRAPVSGWGDKSEVKQLFWP